MVRSVAIMAIMASAVIFALIGLGAGYLAIEYLTIDGRHRDDYVMILAIAPAVGGAALGLVIGCIAALVGKMTGDK